MSNREFERAVVIARAVAEELTCAEASEMLAMSERQVKRLKQRYRAGGESALVHAGVGRPSNRSRPASERARVLALVCAEYGGCAEPGVGQRFGPTLASEHLAEDHGLHIPVATLTRWMRAAGLWSRRRKRPPHRRRRDRKAHFGEMVQLDGSFHDWLEGRAPASPTACLMTMADDATSTQHAEFRSSESFWAAVGVLRTYVRRYGVPRALYTDWKTLYHPLATGPRTAETQFGRICARLGITLIAASSPQAKGRVERAHGINQDRLVKKLRVHGIATYEAANEYLAARYLTAHNARFAKPPGSATNYHLPLDPALDGPDLWCWEDMRRVSNDAVISYHGQKLLLRLRRDMPPNARVFVRATEGGTWRVVYRSLAGREYLLPWRPFPPPVPTRKPSTDSVWSDASRPAANHPWRRQFHADAVAQQRVNSETPAG